MVILFDIDGTLIDHDGAERVAVEILRRKLGLAEPPEAFLARWHEILERHYDRYLAGELTLQGQRRERFREAVDSSLTDEAADRLSDAYLADYLDVCQPYPDVAPCLAELAAYPMGVISNGERSQQQYKLERAGIAGCFGPLILSAECGMAKPARGIFELACREMGVAPSEAVYVGDRRDIDAEAAQSAGLRGVWLDRAGMGGAGIPQIRTLAELPALIHR